MFSRTKDLRQFYEKLIRTYISLINISLHIKITAGATECILLSINMVSTMARFPQISRSGLPDVNYE